ncbi:hypothetical protein PA7_22880 [Pseudonocardia asaccharolytica DSM 44247 = NBRC 16224]|uniref:Uncharacterized protein n=1 Tax=Pseudonocardia asaccharolytica DSM 44247 = NBRC 16224 TaxID=1123024 RepID=A0A511D115_9PSEU|nr:hypothetical protein PA7_22880 [Pseudonocardia asaccharolytica DSM 44247 = NBRC 16224]
MSCSHAEECPLFPLLNASLRGWRDCYCDTEDRWRDCARYKLSRTGRLVPISLLPNGHDAVHLGRAPDAERSGAAEPRHAPPAQLHPGPPSPFEPAPTPVRPPQPSATAHVSQLPGIPPARSRRPAQQARGSKRRWWARLIDWMRGPA